MKVSIILLTHNHWELTHARLWEIYSRLEDVYEVILVDDNSTDVEVAGGISWWLDDMKLPYKLRYIRNNKNMPFGYSMNKGATAADGDVYVFICNDVQITGNFIPQILGVLAEDDRVLIGNRLLDYDTGWNTFNGVVYPYLEGYMLACTANIWDEIGGFDYKTFNPMDVEDIDLSTTALSKNIRLHSLDSSKMKHLVAQTYGYTPERLEITKRNKEKFRLKWCSDNE